MDIKSSSHPSNLMPQALVEVYQGINALSRTFRKGCEGVESLTDATIEVAEFALAGQALRLKNAMKAPVSA